MYACRHPRSNCQSLRGWWSAVVLLSLSAIAQMAISAPPSLPQRNLVLEWRQVDEGTATGNTSITVSGGTTLSTQHSDQHRNQHQQLRVRNGDRAVVRLGQSVPVLWVQAVQGDQAVGRRSQTNSGTAVVQSWTWLESGRQLSLQPRWPGGSQAAVVEVQVDTASLVAGDAQSGMANGSTTPPEQSRSQIATTVLAPLDQWVTIARTGGEQALAPHGAWSTQAIKSQPRQVMQIRVVVP